MPSGISLEEARSLFGDRLITPKDVSGALQTDLGDTEIPFQKPVASTAAENGELLVYRLAAVGDDALTIRALIARFPQAFDAKLLQASGYQLKNEWGIELEPLAGRDTCSTGWALVQPEVLPGSRNHTHPEQDEALQAYAQKLGADGFRRRTAIEAVYDTVLYFIARNERLLEKSWDWTSSQTVDGGLLHVGGFGANGMQILGYSPGIRHGGLGMCPTRQPQR